MKYFKKQKIEKFKTLIINIIIDIIRNFYKNYIKHKIKRILVKK
jgi:hypothetical protein